MSDERRPPENPGAGASPRPRDDSAPVGRGLRRRGAAAQRLPALDCGCRDPASQSHQEHGDDEPGTLFEVGPRRGRRWLTVSIGRRTAWLSGPGVWQLLDDAGHPRQLRQWDSRRRCWQIPSDRADDVISYAEHRLGIRVQVEAVDR